MKKALLLMTVLAAPSAAWAQTVPALDMGSDAPMATAPEARLTRVNAPGPSAAPPPAQVMMPAPAPAPAPVPSAPLRAPPPVAMIAPQSVKLTARETKAVAIAKSWQDNSNMPVHGDEGAVVFDFGATLPSIVCAPLFVCDLQLQPGELVNDINIGDSVRWKISPAASGQGASKTTHVLIKPTDAGLVTNLIVTTDRRVYVLKLVSQPKTWMARVSFTYPEDQQQQWDAFLANQRAEAMASEAKLIEVREATILPTGEDVQRLDFGFDVRGDKPAWRPVRVYSDGRKTYIEFPASLRDDEAPALVGVGPGNEPEVMNYRVDGDRYVIDQVVQRVALITGSGRHQVKVEIQRARRG